jgi:3-oxoacyl-[acyl-carrier protein] reductase
MSDLSRRRAIVTGGARGIGLAVAAKLLKEGAEVALLDRDTNVKAVASELGERCHGLTVDLRDVEATRAAVIEAAEAMGGLWLLVNNAGIFAKTPLLEIDPADWDLMMEVNARAMLVTIQAATPYLIAGAGGRIVNQASMAAKLGTAGEAPYAASKAAVLALTRIAAIELGVHGITVNALCPGYVLTDMGAEIRSAAQIDEWTAKSPLGRLATPEDVAAAVAFLASEEAAYITGESLNVSGGMCSW